MGPGNRPQRGIRDTCLLCLLIAKGVYKESVAICNFQQAISRTATATGCLLDEAEEISARRRVGFVLYFSTLIFPGTKGSTLAFGNVLLDTTPGFQPFGYAGDLYNLNPLDPPNPRSIP